MPIVYLKSGGTVCCTGYTIKEGVVKAIDVKFAGVPNIPEDKTVMAEAAISLDNVLFITPGKL